VSEGQYRSFDNSFKLKAIGIADANSKIDESELNLIPINRSIDDLKYKGDKSGEMMAQSKITQEPAKRKKHVKEKRKTEKYSMMNGLEEDISNSMENLSKRTLYFPPISSNQDINSKLNHNIPIMINTINNTTQTSSNSNKTKFLIERHTDTNSPKQVFSAEQNPTQKSQDFSLKLIKTQIDEKRLISIFEPLNHVLPNHNTLRNLIKDLPIHPTIPRRINHVHNEFCGHIRVRHGDHIDYLVNGELHFVDHSGKVFPHKLEASRLNPIDCRPIKGRTIASVNELISSHVLSHFIFIGQ